MTIADTHEAPKITETSVFRRIQSVMAAAVQYHEPCLIIGPPGIGKTTALHELERRNRSMVLLKATLLNGTKTVFFKLLADELSARTWYYHRPPRQSPDQLHSMLRDALTRWVPEDLIIAIDEAQHLKDETKRLLLDLNEEAGTTVAFVGNPHTLRNSKGNKDALNQIWDRVSGHHVEFTGVAVRDVVAIAADHNVEGSDSYKSLEAFVMEGSLRPLARLLREARIFAGPSGSIRLPHLREAVQLLHGEDEDRRLFKLVPKAQRKDDAA